MSMQEIEKERAQEIVTAAHRSSANVENLLTRMRVLIVAFMFVVLLLLGMGLGVNIGTLASVHSAQSANAQTIAQIHSDVQSINTSVNIHNLELGELLGVACLLVENSKTLPVPLACTQTPAPALPTLPAK